jgi:hypothetical protein
MSLSRFLVVLFWEFVQNVSGVVPFAIAVWLWAQRSKGKAFLCMLAATVGAVLTLYLVEPFKQGHVATLQSALVNFVSTGLLQILVVPYLGSETRWSSRKTDWIAGALAGLALAIAQGLGVQGRFPLYRILLHCVALAVGAALVLVSVRTLKNKPLSGALIGSVLIAVIMTLAIGLIDYGDVLVAP